ncbi:MAG: hypothetical protein HFH82_09040 [Lachnospiraceae bacterium]|nr:hypothetical protein [Lachnospiraceae bacterium]
MEEELLSGVRDVFIEGDYMWVISDNFNCLFGYDFLEQRLDLITVFPETVGTQNFAFHSLLKVGNEIYLFPLTANEIYIFDLLKKEFSTINVPFHGTNNVQGVVSGEYLYCLKRFPDELIRIHLDTKKADIFTAGTPQGMDEAAERQVYRNYLEPCLYQGKIVWAGNGNVLTAFDMETERFSMERLEEVSREKIERTKAYYQGGLEDCIIGAKAFKGILWIFSFDGRIYQYDDRLHKVRPVQTMNHRHNNVGKSTPALWANLIPLRDELWFVPQYKRKCVRYNDKSDLYDECMDEYERKFSESERIEFSFCKAFGDEKIILYSYYESCFFILDAVNGTVEKKKVMVPVKRFLQENLLFRSMKIRNNTYMFDDLQFFFQDTILLSKRQKTVEKLIGDKIFEAIKQC